MKLYGTFASNKIDYALFQLLSRALTRIERDPPSDDAFFVKFPVALLFVRGDCAGPGADLADQALASFKYWNEESAEFIDFVYAGWSKDENGLYFDSTNFLDFRRQVEKRSTWQFSGEAEMLLLNFVVAPGTKSAWFDFSEVICLPIERMLRESMIGSIDALVCEIVTNAQKLARASESTSSPVWQISDLFAVRFASKDLWKSIMDFVFGSYSKKLQEIGHYTVRKMDLEKDNSFQLPDLIPPYEARRRS